MCFVEDRKCIIEALHTIKNIMKLFQMCFIASILMPLNANTAPINNECVNPPAASTRDCPNDPLLTQSWAFDYMNMSYAWDVSYGTARVGVLEVGGRSLTPELVYSAEFGQRIRGNDSGYYNCPGSCIYPYDDSVFVNSFPDVTDTSPRGHRCVIPAS